MSLRALWRDMVIGTDPAWCRHRFAAQKATWKPPMMDRTLARRGWSSLGTLAARLACLSKLILHPLASGSGSLFDRLVGAAKQRKRHSEAEHVGGFEIDYHLSVCSLLLLSRSFAS
jgi:hypothetical protein